ncbi:hypothetical protein L798_12492 [Zootermopsis nevadensis]|uniref:C2H2-type domain-containing protein n=1 Tax=Zootermopsis nevadensis TaxID=136037 RepID=A0A067R2X9_ZOONE|nr:hypothetical protein L798_12492 [Zootermopsis nevadensis]
MNDTTISRVPPPGHTSGKWVPGKQVRLDDSVEDAGITEGGSMGNMLLIPPLRKSGSTIQYWCGSCNRRLSSRTLYERHLLSELHFKRTLQERELEEDPLKAQSDSNDRGSDKRTVRRTEVYLNSELWSRPVRKPKRRRDEVHCEVCSSKVLRHLLGKHLVSHYHCRKARSGHPQAASLVLDNIHSVVRQAPFQCSPCKFYCNTEATFKQHWTSREHERTDTMVSGRYWCSFCKYECESSVDMKCHIEGPVHQELVAVINRSVPIVIRKRTVLSCGSCGEEFRYNAQLRRHVLRAGHHDSSTSSDVYQERFCCSDCRFVGSSSASLQRHILHTHKAEKKGAYFCSACSLNFDSAEEAALHRRSQQHKYSALASRRDRGLSEEVLTKNCPHCGEKFENVLQLKTHLREQHAEFPYRCARCGMTFTLPQEVSRHVRDNKNEEDGECRFVTCSQCSYRTESQAELLFHEVLHGESITDSSSTETGLGTTTSQAQKAMRYQCPLCTRVFRKATLRCHLRTHTQERPFVCTFCYRGFGHRSSMITHVKQTHRTETSIALRHTQRNKSFLCAVCGANFFLKNTLQQHMKIHTGKNFKCQHEGCIFACRSQAELRNHQQVHSDHRPYHCDTCTYSAKTKPQLLRHHTVHLVQRPHQCPHCPFAARIASHLRRHLRLHTGAKPYRCPYCPYTCNILENLRKHVLSTSKHPGKHLYECRFCETGDAFKSNLARDFRAHLVTAHPHHFGSALLAASYVAGIYDANDDPKFVEKPIQLQPRWKR